MPYLLLIGGAGLALYALIRFFIAAKPEDLRKLGAFAVCTAVIGLTLFLAITRQLGAAIAVLAVAAPMARRLVGILIPPRKPGARKADMSREEALEILGLENTATEDHIREAHARLIQKNHPDREGSDWLASKVNRARDVLLKK